MGVFFAAWIKIRARIVGHVDEQERYSSTSADDRTRRIAQLGYQTLTRPNLSRMIRLLRVTLITRKPLVTAFKFDRDDIRRAAVMQRIGFDRRSLRRKRYCRGPTSSYGGRR